MRVVTFFEGAFITTRNKYFLSESRNEIMAVWNVCVKYDIEFLFSCFYQFRENLEKL